MQKYIKISERDYFSVANRFEMSGKYDIFAKNKYKRQVVYGETK